MTLILSGTDGLSDIDGSAATPAIRGTDANTGIFFPAADTMAMATGGTEAMRIDSAGNVGIGTSSLSALLTINSETNTTAYNGSATDGQLTAGATQLIRAAAGANTNVAQLVFQSRASQPFNRIVSSGGTAPFMAFATNNAERARIDSSGNVGIGTSSPTQELHLYKDQNATTEILIENPNAGTSGRAQLELSPELGSAYFTANSSTSTVSAIAGGALGAGLYTTSALSNGLSVGTTAGALKFFAGSTSAERMRIDSSGNVGVGNTAANVNDQVGAVRPLLVSKSDTSTTIAGSQANIVIGNADTTTNNTSQLSFAAITGANTTYFASAAINCVFGARTNGQYPTGQLTFSTSTSLNSAPTEKMRIDSSGNVGIGTSSPAVKLHIETSSGSAAFFVNSPSATDVGSYISLRKAGSAKFLLGVESTLGGTSDNGALYVYGANALTMHTNGSERARIDSSGNLLVGTTTSTITSATSGLVVNSAGYLDTKRNTTSTAAHYQFANPNGFVGSITTSGSATAYNTSSDYRLKHDIAPMTGALAKVAALKPVTYKWNADNSAGEGFIAHELAEVVPQCVTGEKDAVETYTDEEGNEQTRPKYQGIDTSFLVATLTAAIQELKAINDAQAQTIQSLTARIEALEGK